jgi:hypothetical protein
MSAPLPFDKSIAAAIDENIGELSRFHETLIFNRDLLTNAINNRINTIRQAELSAAARQYSSLQSQQARGSGHGRGMRM